MLQAVEEGFINFQNTLLVNAYRRAHQMRKRLLNHKGRAAFFIYQLVNLSSDEGEI